MDIPSYDIEKIKLDNYNKKTRNIILSNLKKYTKLKIFECSDCDLDKLPELPNSLIHLECDYNDLTKLPKLPNSLISLYCSRCNLKELPENLPISLKELYCSLNKIRELPKELPNGLINLDINLNNSTFMHGSKYE